MNSALAWLNATYYFLNSDLTEGSHLNLPLCCLYLGVNLIITQWFNKGILRMTKRNIFTKWRYLCNYLSSKKDYKQTKEEHQSYIVESFYINVLHQLTFVSFVRIDFFKKNFCDRNWKKNLFAFSNIHSTCRQLLLIVSLHVHWVLKSISLWL